MRPAVVDGSVFAFLRCSAEHALEWDTNRGLYPEESSLLIPIVRPELINVNKLEPTPKLWLPVSFTRHQQNCGSSVFHGVFLGPQYC